MHLLINYNVHVVAGDWGWVSGVDVLGHLREGSGTGFTSPASHDSQPHINLATVRRLWDNAALYQGRRWLNVSSPRLGLSHRCPDFESYSISSFLISLRSPKSLSNILVISIAFFGSFMFIYWGANTISEHKSEWAVCSMPQFWIEDPLLERWRLVHTLEEVHHRFIPGDVRVFFPQTLEILWTEKASFMGCGQVHLKAMELSIPSGRMALRRYSTSVIISKQRD